MLEEVLQLIVFEILEEEAEVGAIHFIRISGFKPFYDVEGKGVHEEQDQKEYTAQSLESCEGELILMGFDKIFEVLVGDHPHSE